MLLCSFGQWASHADRFADPTCAAKVGLRQQQRLRAALGALCDAEGGEPDWAKLVALADDSNGGRLTIDDLKAGCRATLGLTEEQLPDTVIVSLFRQADKERRGEVDAVELVLLVARMAERMSEPPAGALLVEEASPERFIDVEIPSGLSDPVFRRMLRSLRLRRLAMEINPAAFQSRV